jgi:hypothetical protein
MDECDVNALIFAAVRSACKNELVAHRDRNRLPPVTGNV